MIRAFGAYCHKQLQWTMLEQHFVRHAVLVNRFRVPGLQTL